jgi:hypothetical protein
MNNAHDDPNVPAPATDAWLDDLLAADGAVERATYIDDAGFTARVVESLPRTAVLPAWRTPIVATLWGAAAVALVLAMPSLFVDVLREAHRLFSAQPFSLAGVGIVLAAIVALTLGAAAWSLDDRG